MPIVAQGKTSNAHDIDRQYILILNGDYRGEVWMIDETTIERIYNTEMPINALTIMEDITYGGV